MSPEHREYAELLLERAREDLRAAQVFAATEGSVGNVVGFHLQQAVEKGLKCVLAGREIEIPRTHDLEELVRAVAETEVQLPRSLTSPEWLTPWSVLFRYDDQSVDLDFDKGLEAATAAIGLAEHVLAEDNTDPAA